MHLNRRSFMGAALAAGGALAVPGCVTAGGRARHPGWHAGYTTAPAEGFPAAPMTLVSGKPPAGLSGTLYRNGPAQFRYGDAYASHWFDADGMIQRIRIEDGRAVHSGKFVETPKRRAEQDAGRFLAAGFGTAGDPGYAVGGSDDVNAANTSVILAGGELLALWEAGSPWRVDPETLESLGPKAWRDDLKGMPYLAHPKREPDGRIWNLGVAGTQVAIYLSGADGALLRFGLTDMGAPAYVHDWAMTRTHLIILVQPWLYTRTNPPFAGTLAWRPEEGLKILIVDKDDFSKTRWSQAPARSFYHTGAAWTEADGTVKLDVAFYPEPVLGAAGGVRAIRGEGNGKEGGFEGAFSLLVIPPTGDARITETGLDGDFPQVDPRRHGEARRLSAIVTAPAVSHPGATALSLHDWDRGTSEAFRFGEHRMVEEFLFVPKPGADREEDSWLIGPVLNTRTARRELHVFDTARISDGPVCTWEAAYTWPLGFHGTWG